MYYPGDEILGALIIDRAPGNQFILRCECQSTFTMHQNKIMYAVIEQIPPRCLACNLVNPSKKVIQPGRLLRTPNPCDRVVLAFRLRFQEGWTQSQIARALNVRVQTISNYFVRWRGRIAEYEHAEREYYATHSQKG